MQEKRIDINVDGVKVFGFPIGISPTARDFELAFKDLSVRSHQTTNYQRELKICDSMGLCWLIDLRLQIVLWFQIRLGPLGHRKLSEADPSDYFKGKVCIGSYTISGMFSFEIVEVIRQIMIPGMSVDFVPDERRICAITVNFRGNEDLAEAENPYD